MKIKGLLLSLCFLGFGFSANSQQIFRENVWLGNYDSNTAGWGTRMYFKGSSYNNSDIFMSRYSVDTGFKTDLRIWLGAHKDGENKFVIGNEYWNATGVWRDFFVVTNQGRVGINGVRDPRYQLEVNGTIRAKEIIVETGGSWADYVFAPEYKLPALKEVEAHIKKHKHLPDIPSEAEVLENGVGLGEMNVKLLQKIEELTLYIIEQDKRIEALEAVHK